jgi:hypothetical protein
MNRYETILYSDKPDPNVDQASACTDGGSAVANFGENLGWAVADIFGIGGMIRGFSGGDNTPQSVLKSQISQVNSNITNLQRQMTIDCARLDNEIFKNILIDMNKSNQMMTAAMNFNDELLREDISTNSMYAIVSFILILITMYYLLFTMK